MNNKKPLAEIIRPNNFNEVIGQNHLFGENGALSIIEKTKNLILNETQKGGKIIGLGASTKGNVLLQICGFDKKLLPFISDRNKDKVCLRTLGTDFEIERYGDIGNAAPDRIIDLVGIVPPNSTYLMEVGSSGQGNCPGLSTDYDDFGAGINENDEIRLTKNGNPYDVVYCPNEIGYSISRINSAAGPSATYDGADWNLNLNETCWFTK